MHRSGILIGLLRERHPFVALALLALLVPSLFVAGGIHVHAAHTETAGATVVICTGDGFERVTIGNADDVPATHEQICHVACVHGISGQGLVEAADSHAVIAEQRAIPRPACGSTSRPARSSLQDPIRAPPAKLA
jgi:hypothetical protein